jgi:hypothetical protein
VCSWCQAAWLHRLYTHRTHKRTRPAATMHATKTALDAHPKGSTQHDNVPTLYTHDQWGDTNQPLWVVCRFGHSVLLCLRYPASLPGPSPTAHSTPETATLHHAATAALKSTNATAHTTQHAMQQRRLSQLCAIGAPNALPSNPIPKKCTQC